MAAKAVNWLRACGTTVIIIIIIDLDITVDLLIITELIAVKYSFMERFTR